MRNAKGFTLIELLIVVVIIGILAAIAIPRFSSTKEKAFDAAAKSDLRNSMSAQEAYFADNQVYTSAATWRSRPARAWPSAAPAARPATPLTAKHASLGQDLHGHRRQRHLDRRQDSVE